MQTIRGDTDDNLRKGTIRESSTQIMHSTLIPRFLTLQTLQDILPVV